MQRYVISCIHVFRRVPGRNLPVGAAVSRTKFGNALESTLSGHGLRPTAGYQTFKRVKKELLLVVTFCRDLNLESLASKVLQF